LLVENQSIAELKACIISCLPTFRQSHTITEVHQHYPTDNQIVAYTQDPKRNNTKVTKNKITRIKLHIFVEISFAKND